MDHTIDSLKAAIPAGLKEIKALDATLTSRSQDIPTCFDHSHTSNCLTEATDRLLERLRAVTLRFRNLTHHITYITRSLIHS
ncbi:transposase [Actinomyces capricornis]|uniref:Uncharacterized protein n=1 Tax=Actinomyces capricornis TaxID=2755559 RepID=A0ABM7UIE6_9ACTO|nr:transposase [Actinomyces capricornis]BDA64358.1 hypothetical protein MANAM107_11920 [Actinomyces capricornis]